MGMDFEYAGSASYPRFDRELCEIAKVFGGVETKHLKDKREKEIEGSFDYWFGFYSSLDSKVSKFSFPKGTNETIIKWLNNAYNELTEEETKIVWKQISNHPEIKEISFQIWNEFEMLVFYNEGWSIW